MGKLFTKIATMCLMAGAAAPAWADVVNFSVDSSQSSASIEILDSGVQSTPTTGSLILNLDSLTEPFGVAQITDLNLVLQNQLDFSLLGGLVSLSTRPNDTTLSLLLPGDGGTVTGGQFDQLNNIMVISGIADVSDPLGLLGAAGDSEFDLSTLGQTLVDYTNVGLVKSGDQYTLTADFSLDQTVEFNGVDVDISITGTVVANGFAAVPEPGSALALGALGLVAAGTYRRREG